MYSWIPTSSYLRLHLHIILSYEMEERLNSLRLYKKLHALLRCHTAIAANPKQFLFEESVPPRKRSGNILVQLLSDTAREQYQKATNVIFYNEYPFSEILRVESPLAAVNKWSFDAKINFIAYLTGPTRTVIGELKNRLIASDSSLADAIEMILSPIPGEPNPDRSPDAFRDFLAQEWRISFFSLGKSQRTATMNSYAEAYALLWITILKDISRVCNAASEILGSIASAIGDVLFDEYADQVILNRPIDFSQTVIDTRSNLLLKLRKLCISIHLQLIQLEKNVQARTSIFKAASILTNIIPPFRDVRASDAERQKRDEARAVTDDRDVIIMKLFQYARELCEILDSSQFRAVQSPTAPDTYGENEAIASIKSKLIELSKSDTIRELVIDVNIPLGLGLSNIAEMDKKYPLLTTESLKLPIVLWLRHTFFGEILDNKNTEFERLTTMALFARALQAKSFVYFLDMYMKTSGALNTVSEILRVSRMSPEKKIEGFYISARDIAFTNANSATFEIDRTEDQKKFLTAITPFRYADIDTFFEARLSDYANDSDRAAFVLEAKTASRQIQSYEENWSYDIPVLDQSEIDVDADMLACIVGACPSSEHTKKLRDKLETFSIDRDIDEIERLSTSLAAKTADVFGIYAIDACKLLREITERLMSISTVREEDTSLAGAVRPPPAGTERSGGNPRVQSLLAEFKRMSFDLMVNEKIVADINTYVMSMSDAAIRLFDPDVIYPRPTDAEFRAEIAADAANYVAFIIQNGDIYFEKLLKRDEKIAMEVLRNMKILNRGFIEGKTEPAFISATKIITEDLAYHTIFANRIVAFVVPLIFVPVATISVGYLLFGTGFMGAAGQIPAIPLFNTTDSANPLLHDTLNIVTSALTYVLETNDAVPAQYYAEGVVTFVFACATLAYKFGEQIVAVMKMAYTYSKTKSPVDATNPFFLGLGALATGALTYYTGMNVPGYDFLSQIVSAFQVYFARAEFTTYLNAVASTVFNVETLWRYAYYAFSFIITYGGMPNYVVGTVRGILFKLYGGAEIDDLIGRPPAADEDRVARFELGASAAAVKTVATILNPTEPARNIPASNIARVWTDSRNVMTGAQDVFYTMITHELGKFVLYASFLAGISLKPQSATKELAFAGVNAVMIWFFASSYTQNVRLANARAVEANPLPYIEKSTEEKVRPLIYREFGI